MYLIYIDIWDNIIIIYDQIIYVHRNFVNI